MARTSCHPVTATAASASPRRAESPIQTCVRVSHEPSIDQQSLNESRAERPPYSRGPWLTLAGLSGFTGSIPMSSQTVLPAQPGNYGPKVPVGTDNCSLEQTLSSRVFVTGARARHGAVGRRRWASTRPGRLVTPSPSSVGAKSLGVHEGSGSNWTSRAGGQPLDRAIRTLRSAGRSA